MKVKDEKQGEEKKGERGKKGGKRKQRAKRTEENRNQRKESNKLSLLLCPLPSLPLCCFFFGRQIPHVSSLFWGFRVFGVGVFQKFSEWCCTDILVVGICHLPCAWQTTCLFFQVQQGLSRLPAAAAVHAVHWPRTNVSKPRLNKSLG